MNYQPQTNGHDLLGYRCQPDTSSYTINAKPMGTILSAIDVNRTLAINQSMAIKGRDLNSYWFQQELITLLLYSSQSLYINLFILDSYVTSFKHHNLQVLRQCIYSC